MEKNQKEHKNLFYIFSEDIEKTEIPPDKIILLCQTLSLGTMHHRSNDKGDENESTGNNQHSHRRPTR